MPSINHSQQPGAIKQNELQEMLGNPPGWILRSGITLIFIIVAIALSLSWLVRYPDELPAQITIVRSILPHELRPLITARIDTLFKDNGDFVESGDRIALLENAADWKHVDSLWQLLQDEVLDSIPEKLNLGSLQPQYAALLKARSDLQFFNSRSIFRQREIAIKKEIATLQQLRLAQREQSQFFLREKQIIQKNLERTQTLHDEGVSSAIELEEHQKQLLQYEQQLKDLEVVLLQNRLRIQQLRAQLSENEDEYLRNKNELELSLTQNYQQLKGAIEEWFSLYVLGSPVAGKLELKMQLGRQYTVQAGSLLGTVVPKYKNSAAVAQLQMPANGMGKISIGAPVKISLDAYPRQEYGQINAKIDEISQVPVQGEKTLPEYTLKVYLSDTLKTAYGKKSQCFRICREEL